MAFEEIETHHDAPNHASGMENILPPSISKLERPLPATPRMTQSMSDSFMLEHGYPRPQSPQTPDTSKSAAPQAPPKDVLPPATLSNWAHLSLIKNQRNSLQTELKAHQVAGAEARASVAALRRLAFRLAVNISVKEKKIATATKELAGSRKNDYLASRNAEKRIEKLTRSLKEEERRNREILETLERASKLTLECTLTFLR